MSDDRRTELEDRDLIQRMALKDAEALDAFYERYNRLAFSLIVRILGDPAEAEDVLVDVFWQVWQQSSRYNASRGKPVAWVLTIARSRAIDALRASNRRQVKHEPLEPDQPALNDSAEDDVYVRSDMQKAVREALQMLSEQQRIPLEMAYFQGMSHTEIASALSQPLGTVKDRIRTGMMHLRRTLKAYL
jgi:RNA polymerase sigma-70 factor (ECF subfamily)